jgi:L-lactate dehydrogenase complex protein LldG
MAERFGREIEALGGEAIRTGSTDAAAAKLAELADAAGWQSIGGMDRPLCRELAARLGEDRVLWSGDADPKQMAALDVGLVEADYLLADTGTAMVACGEPRQRLLCYLPPASVVVARTERLVEHMPAVWEEIAGRCADPALRGEFVFITGPSRTADIEKILILGVHGPKRLVVLMVDR